MASSGEHCCDPFKKHNTIVATSLERVDRGLLKKWSPLISAGDVVCGNCRKDLCILQPCFVDIRDDLNLSIEREQVEERSKSNTAFRFVLYLLSFFFFFYSFIWYLFLIY